MTDPQRESVFRYSTKGETFSKAMDISSSIAYGIFGPSDDAMFMNGQFDLTCYNNPALMTAMITAQQASIPGPNTEVNSLTWYHAPQGAGEGLPLYTITAWIVSVTLIANMIELVLMPTNSAIRSVQ